VFDVILITGKRVSRSSSRFQCKKSSARKAFADSVQQHPAFCLVQLGIM
jgi:hypothetical protein